VFWRRKVNAQKYALTVAIGEAKLLARARARLSLCITANDQEWGLVMSKEFDRLKSLIDLSKPSERDPQVDRDEAAKLAARWEWLTRRAREQRGERSQVRRPLPDKSLLLRLRSFFPDPRPE
jgi:hypothetical protein